MTQVAHVFAAVFALAAAAQAVETPTLEDSASDVARTLTGLRSDAAAEKLAIQTKGVTGIDVRQDCEKVSFAENAGSVSGPIDLRSETWLEQCDHIPLPNPPGGGVCLPRRTLLRADVRTVRVEIVGRAAPGPKEVFQVCLWGNSLSLKVKESPFRYHVAEREEPLFNSTLVLTKKN